MTGRRTSICRPFRSTCWSTTAFSGAGGLLLTEGDSYRSLVGVPATHSDKPRVEPSDPDGSFLLDVLTAEGAVAYPHTGLVTRSEDINLLRVWIEKGCPQN